MPTPPKPALHFIPTLHTAESAAALAGLPLRVVRDAMYARAFPTTKFGRRVYVSESDLLAWISAHTREGIR